MTTTIKTVATQAAKNWCSDSDFAARVEEMAAELRDLAPEAGQHEALMRARWGGDFSPDVFSAAVSIVESEREASDVL